MKDINYHAKTQKALEGKYKGQKAILSRASPRYPSSAEREYRRINRAYSNVVGGSLRKHLPSIMEAYKRGMRSDSREDGIFDFIAEMHQRFMDMAAEIEAALERFNIESAIERVSRMAQKNAIREWKRVVRRTLGLEITDEYYEGGKYEQAIQQWISGNVSRVRSIPSQAVQDLENIVKEAYREGKSAREAGEEIQKAYNLSRRKADMIARDQMSTLNSQITKMQHQDAGVKRYEWLSARDGSVRDCHQEFDGNIYSWDDPPDDWYMTKSRGTVYTGYKFNPGEAWCCRCVAVPVFELEAASLPVR